MSELSERIKAGAKQRIAEGTLRERIRLTRLQMGYKSEGIDRLLDLTPLEQGELIIFCKRQSLLMEAIKLTRKTRTPEETVKALMLGAVKGYCQTCYEQVTICACSEVDRDWV